MHLRSAAALFAALATTAGIAAPAASATTPSSPPPLTVLTQSGSLGDRDIFITPSSSTSTTYANGPEIISQSGKVVWFDPVPADESAADFRTQRYDGQRVLTFWAGTGLGGLSTGTDYIYNRHYQQIAAVKASNGLSADGEFVGWGRLPYISAFDSAGKLVFNAEFPTGWNTYRAYLQRWDSNESQAQARRHR